MSHYNGGADIDLEVTKVGFIKVQMQGGATC